MATAPRGTKPGPTAPGTQPRTIRAKAPKPPSRARALEEIKAAKRLKEIELQKKKLEAERQRLLPKVAAREPQTFRLADFRRREGFTYHTWFKALGTFGGIREMKGGDTPDLVNEMMEFQDFDIPSAFYSHSILGQVKWAGIRDREGLIKKLNLSADWAPNDFRDIYLRWEYTYQIVESVGDVPVAIFEYRAAYPKRRGWNVD